MSGAGGGAVRVMPDGRLTAAADGGSPAAWERAADIVLEGIGSGRLPGGARVPAAATLGARSGCQEETARRALRFLSAAGFLSPVPAGGYRVRPDIAARLLQMRAPGQGGTR